MRSENINELAAALSKAQGQMEAAKKDAKNVYFKSSYSTLSSVIEAIKGPFRDAGLSFSQLLNQGVDGLMLETILMHEGGQYLSSEVLIEVQAKKGLSDAQALGSTLTYYKRYALASIAGISSAEEDDDGQATQPQPPAKITKAQNGKEPPAANNSPTDFKELFTLVNQAVQVPYDAPAHMLNAIRKVLEDEKWNPPASDNVEGWRSAYTIAKKYADDKLTEPLFPDEE